MSKELSYLGVDIGASGIKVVELANEGGRPCLVTYGFSDHASQKIKDVLSKPDIKGKEMANLCKEAGVSTKNVITGLPMPSVFTTLFTFSQMSDKELEKKIESKVKKLAPMPPEDIVMDWRKASTADKDKSVKVSVTAASKKMINEYVAVFKSAGLQLASLETESFALIRSLLGKDRALSIIVDIGSLKTNILVAKEGIPIIRKTIKMGGQNITKLLSEKLKVDIGKAEEVKKNLSLGKVSGANVILEDIVKSIVNEIKYSQNLYLEQYSKEGVEKIILTGGSALTFGIIDTLQKETGLRVFVGDPWARVVYPDELRPVLDKIGSRFSVAIGLAMREIL